MDTTYLEEQIKLLKEEQERVQLSIITDTHKIEIIQQTMKFRNKRLKSIEKELEFWENELSKHADQAHKKTVG